MLPPSQRFFGSGILLSAAVLAAAYIPGLSSAVAQEASPPAASAPAASAPAAPAVVAAVIGGDLQTHADDFLYYSLVNNVDLAKANGQALLNDNADAKAFVAAFEAVARGRDAREIMLRNQKREDLKDISKQLLDKLEEGYRASARDPVRIRAEIARLANGPRAKANAKERLAAAGQFAAPFFIEVLQDEKKKDLQPYVLRVMGEIGRPLLLPLIEELSNPDQVDKVALVNVIGQIGYPQALPTLRAVASEEKSTEALKAAANNAIALIDKAGTASKSAADLYLVAAQGYYASRPSYQPLLANEATNPVWQYDKAINNIAPVAVPTPIWHDIMAMRNAAAVLKLQPNNATAISLWIAADLRREIQLPAGATDPLKAASTPEAAFYALAAGPIYINPVLAQGLSEHDSALILKAIDALEATGGNIGLVGPNAPLVRALSYPDRAVRFRAAFALARANPAKEFPSSYRVVPVLAEAISSTGTPNAVVVSPDENTRNKLAGVLRDSAAHYNVYSGSSLSAALESARRAPAFDVVIAANGAEVARVGQLAATDYRLAASPVLVTGPASSVAALKAGLAGTKNYGALDEAADEAAINAVLTDIRANTGNLPVDQTAANVYSATAIKLLSALAGDHASIYKVEDAVPTLIEALKDKRADVAGGAAGILGQLASVDAQKVLASAALSADVDASLKVPFLVALAESAKRIGNALDATSINGLIKVVNNEADPAIKKAAATALGALNVPSNQASTLILNQAK